MAVAAKDKRGFRTAIVERVHSSTGAPEDVAGEYVWTRRGARDNPSPQRTAFALPKTGR